MNEAKKRDQKMIGVTSELFEELKRKLGKEEGVSWSYLLKKLLEKAGY